MRVFHTIQLSSHVSVQGEIAEVLSNGDVVIRDGVNVYRGRPIGRGDGLPPAPAGVIRRFRQNAARTLEP
jgi:hypothetical protein